MAFDSIPHEALLNLIQQLRASKNIQRSIRQIHEETKGAIQGTKKHFRCKRGVYRGSIGEPILVNLFLQKVPEEVYSHCDNNGEPLTTSYNKEQWTLQHPECDDDLVVATDSPEIA